MPNLQYIELNGEDSAARFILSLGSFRLQVGNFHLGYPKKAVKQQVEDLDGFLKFSLQFFCLSLPLGQPDHKVDLKRQTQIENPSRLLHQQQ